jgi:signal transduction histidine kinase
MEPSVWWIYSASCLFAGALYSFAGLIALWASPRNALARSFGKAGIFSGLLIGLLFDFHTTRNFAPLFLVAFAMVPGSWIVFVLRLPDDAPVLRRFPMFERLADGAGAMVAASFLWQYATRGATKQLQQVWTWALAASVLLSAATFLLRFALARGVRRDRLRALLVTVVPPHLVIAAVILAKSPGVSIDAAVFGMLSLFPLATAYACIRYDLWGSRALLSRLLTRLCVGALASAVAVAIGTALATWLGAPFRSALLSVCLGSVATPLIVSCGLRAVDRFIFGSRVNYKPTVAQLSEELIEIASPQEVARAVERTIRRWLPCELVELSLGDAMSLVSTQTTRCLDAVDDASSPDAVQLNLSVEFGGAALGGLRVGNKSGGALFTSDDMDLLRTIVNQGALALAHAYAYQELELRRRDQAAAWRGERALLVETLAAEIAHEIRYPINFFRSVFEQGSLGRPLDTEDLEIGREEVDRLERLVSGLRRMVMSHRLERRPVLVSELCDRVEGVLRDMLVERRIERAVPVNTVIRCDPDQVLQMLVNLVANALEAAGEGPVGIAWNGAANGAELLVWDTGPGFGEDAGKLFAPGYTTRPRGTGLGLAITQRLARAHGWSVAALRRNKFTQFVISIPREDVVVSMDGAASAGAA